MSRMQICVAMCTYNGSRYLGEQLESIAAQTRLPDRMLILDDGSSDDTLDIAREFARGAAFPVHIERNRQNLGYTKNFEKAVGLADGDVIALSDQDDVWHPAKLASAERAFSGSPSVGMVFTDAEVADAALRPLGYRLWSAVGLSKASQERVRNGQTFDLLLKGNLVTGATMAFRSSLRDLVLPIDAGCVHDGWIALLISAVADVAAIDQPLVRYRQHGDNQIGIAPRTLARRVTRPRHVAAQDLGRIRQTLSPALSRLQDRGGVSPARLELLREAVHHLDARLGLPDGRAARLRPIYREVVRGRYRLLSNGVASALRDLIA
jgi:glycosyltransferase involved in cell wall biosynthesis